MASRITDKLVKELAAPDKGNRIVYDAKISGFGIRVTAAGAKSFVLNYRIDGRERRYTIGSYGPGLWGVERARKRAGECRRLIDRGEDPLAERIGKRRAPTVADLCDRYEEDHLPRKRESSAKEDRAMIAKIIRPKIGSMKVESVRYTDVDRLHRSMKATPYRANRMLALLSKMFSLAVVWEMRAESPTKGVERFPEAKRHRYLSAEELGRLTETLAKHPDQQAANVVRLLLLTGARKGEALSAEWSQIDLEAGTWTKPGATTKQNTEHRTPLSDAAVTLLKGIQASAARDDSGDLKSAHLFPGRNPGAPLEDVKHAWSDLRKAAKIKDVRIHDLRHSFASILASAGASLPLIGALLGHTQPATTARYAHLFDDPQRKAANTVGAIVTGKPSAEVVKLRKDGAA